MKRLLSLIIMVAMIFALTPTTANAAVKINKSKATIYIGNTLELKITGNDKYVMWKSGDKKIAKVSSKGIVTGVNKGTTTITATIGPGSNNVKLTCKITVKPRLSTKNSNIVCLLDEYYEIPISFVKAKNDEYLAYIKPDDGIITAEWEEDDTNILRIIPNEIGSTNITIYTATGDNFRDFSINRDEKLNIRITVLNDLEWISSKDLDTIGISSLMTKTYFIKNGELPNATNTIYNDNGLEYKYDGNEVYYNIASLKKLNIMK